MYPLLLQVPGQFSQHPQPAVLHQLLAGLLTQADQEEGQAVIARLTVQEEGEGKVPEGPQQGRDEHAGAPYGIGTL